MRGEEKKRRFTLKTIGYKMLSIITLISMLLGVKVLLKMKAMIIST